MALTATSFPKKREKTGGRAKGTPNKSTAAGREFAEQLVNDPLYRANLRERLVAGRLPPGVEVMLWYYAVGKPKEQLEVAGIVSGRDVTQMSTDELLAELEVHHAATAAFLASQHHQRTPQAQDD